MTAQGGPSVEAECLVGEVAFVLHRMSAVEATAGMEPAETATADRGGETELVLRPPALEKLCKAAA
jgi:hypothetical protein